MQLSARTSIFGRLARNATLVAVVAVLLLLAVTWGTLDTAMRRSLEANTSTDLAGLVDIYASGGQSELLGRIRDRVEMTSIEGRASHYILADDTGAMLAGNVAKWPALNASMSDRAFITLNDGTNVYARTARLGPGLNLLVSREYADDLAALHRLIGLFLAVGMGIVGAVAWMARHTGKNLQHRIGLINQSFRNPEALENGTLPAAGTRPDEIDELAEHSARSLARQARLARMHKHMSDNVAHEIRTPLMHLDNRLVTAIAEHPAADGEGPLTKARGDIRQIVALLDSLLDIAANQARRGDRTGLEELDLSLLLSEIAFLYEGSFEDAGLKLETRIHSGIKFKAEQMQLTRLVSNLLDNAIKYVPKGGKVRLELSPGPRIIVADDGPGIPAVDREKVFSRFSRNGADRNVAGHGLGLSLARAIAERHGLSLSLVDADEGACFLVEPD